MESQADDLDVENLFNDENLNNAALGGGILSENAILQDAGLGTIPAQTLKLSKLAANGCLNELTWTKPGVIARIKSNGTTVETFVQRANPKDGKWMLSDPRPLDTTFENAIGLTWHQGGAELAVLDGKGRTSVFNVFPSALNKFHRLRDGSSDQADETNRPIGYLWLTLARSDRDRKKTVLENVKENGRWKHEHIEGGVYPPYLLRGLCFVSQTGTFTLLSTRDGGPLQPATLTLPVSDEAITFTHAAMSQTPEGRLLVAMHGTHGGISTFYVEIASSPSEPVTLSAEVIDLRIPGGPPYINLEHSMTADLGEAWLLTHLQILPESEWFWEHLNKPHIKPRQPATLIAVYSSYTEQKNAAGDNFLGTTIAKRWHFRKSQVGLRAAFQTAAAGNQAQVTFLQPLADVALPAPITNLQVIEPGNIIATTSIDGTTVFWDSATMARATNDADSRIVTSIGSVNLDYPHLARSITQCISQHGMVLAHINDACKLELAMPGYRDFTVSNSDTIVPRELDVSNPVDEAIVAAYILAFSRCCWNHNSTSDDIISSIRCTIRPSSFVHVRRQLFTTLFQPKNLVPGPGNVSELDKLPHSLITVKALAFHFFLFDTQGEVPKDERTAHLWAWLVLNLRWCISVLGDTYKSMHPPPQNAPNPNQPPRPVSFPPTFLDLVCANIRWVFALYNYIFQSLLSLGDRQLHPHFFNGPPDDIIGDGRQGLVALLLNHSWSRSFLTIMARLIKACAQRGGLQVNFNRSKPLVSPVSSNVSGSTLWRISLTIQACCLKHGLTVDALEKILDRKYHPDQWGSETQNWEILRKQIDMMVTGKVGSEYEGTVQKIMDECLAGPDGLRARGEIDRLRLMEEMPDQGFVFLNMDDIAFAEHTPKMCVDATTGTNKTATHIDIKDALGTETRTKPKSKVLRYQRPLYDTHKKLPVFSFQSVDINPAGTQSSQPPVLPKITTTSELLAAQIRRCVRCGSLSDCHIDPTVKLGQGAWPRSLLALMNKCICDGSWIVEGVGEGLHT